MFVKRENAFVLEKARGYREVYKQNVFTRKMLFY